MNPAIEPKIPPVGSRFARRGVTRVPTELVEGREDRQPVLDPADGRGSTDRRGCLSVCAMAASPDPDVGVSLTKVVAGKPRGLRGAGPLRNAARGVRSARPWHGQKPAAVVAARLALLRAERDAAEMRATRRPGSAIAGAGRAPGRSCGSAQVGERHGAGGVDLPAGCAGARRPACRARWTRIAWAFGDRRQVSRRSKPAPARRPKD